MAVADQRWAASAVLVVAAFFAVAPARSQDAGMDASTGGSFALSETTTEPRISQVGALIAKNLDVSVDPQELFDVPLGDEDALQVESVRIRALLRAVDQSASAAAIPSSSSRVRAPSAASAASPVASTRADIETLDPARWRARIALDRERLAFYALSRDQRHGLVSAHEARRIAARPRETEEARRARETEEERQRALSAARTARSEAERLVREEEARLINVESAVVATRKRFEGLRKELLSRRDMALGWQRRGRDARVGSAGEADATYDALRRTLRTTRDELGASLDQLDASETEVPSVGPDPLSEISTEISTERARERRRRVESLSREVRSEETQLRQERASILTEEMIALNRERLGLLLYLSAEKRSAVTGFTEAGFEQARAEARHLYLILRYHRHIATTWLTSFRDSGVVGGISVWRVAASVVPWLLTGLSFFWWRRRSPALLALADERIADRDRNERMTLPSRTRRAFQFFQGVQRPLELLLAFSAILWLLPVSAQGLLEVQLLIVIVGWSVGAALIVNAINALAAAASASGLRTSDQEGGLRLQSLRLVGRVVVAFILALVLSSRLVGEGTVYRWVLFSCWFAAVPVFLVLVRWWRETVFARVERVRRKSRMQTWVLANRRGWKSFLAAMIAAVHLFAVGLVRVSKNWLTSFDVARRAHAYLFKRELDRLAGNKPTSESCPLKPQLLDSLGPTLRNEIWIDCPADNHWEALGKRVTEARGGVVAIIGGRGSGKSTLVRRLQSSFAGSRLIACHANTTEAEISRSVAQPSTQLEYPNELPLVLLDDAHSLAKPVLGGLTSFAKILAFAQAQSSKTLWVFAIDGVIWPFLRRACDARPLFDNVMVLDPWTDTQIGALLTCRCADAKIHPTFEDLVDKLPPSADEIDRQEALTAKRIGYFRMIWDYARGNPAMALEVWRSSLVEAADGTIRVRPLQAPDAAQLESLPDSALFILRAVLQMAPATVFDVALSTRLAEGHVQDVFRFGVAHGYLGECGDAVVVTWAWLRAVVQLLERRHLLVNP